MTFHIWQQVLKADLNDQFFEHQNIHFAFTLFFFFNYILVHTQTHTRCPENLLMEDSATSLELIEN